MRQERKRNETKKNNNQQTQLGSNFKSGKARLSVRGEEKFKESARYWIMGLFCLFFSVLLLGCVIHKYRETRRRCVLGARFIQARNTHTRRHTQASVIEPEERRRRRVHPSLRLVPPLLSSPNFSPPLPPSLPVRRDPGPARGGVCVCV